MMFPPSVNSSQGCWYPLLTTRTICFKSSKRNAWCWCCLKEIHCFTLYVQMTPSTSVTPWHPFGATQHSWCVSWYVYEHIQSFIKSLGLWIYQHINVGAHFCIIFQDNFHTIEHYMNEAFFWSIQCSCAIIQPWDFVVQNNL
jgi:hypothetical protein